ncbi:hypothetical protein ES708_33300 [subsurface metagenome]
MEHLHTGLIGKANLMKLKLPLHRGYLNCLGTILDFRFDIEQFEDARSGGHSPLELSIQHSQLEYGAKETLDIEQKGDENTRPHLSCQNLISTEDKYQAKGDAAQYLDCRCYDRL